MSEQNTGLVPRLRFPEFREAGEWEERQLGDLCLEITNGKANAEDHEEEGSYPLFDRSEIIKRSNTFAFDAETVILPGEGMRFQPKYYQGRFNLHQRAYALMKHRCNARLLYYLMDHFSAKLAQNAVKSTVLSLRLPIIKKFEIPVPPKEVEQRKIASCLSSLDTLIAAQTDKLDALKTHKKGLMQQLFPREGETVPRLRFPEFWEAGEWQRKTLEKVSSAIFDGTHQTPAYTVEGIPFFSVENIVSGKANKFISREDYLVATSKNKPEKGDILITRIGKIGFSVVVDWDYAFSIYVTLAVIKKSEVFDSFYLNGYFQSERYQKEILANSLLTAVPCKINMDELRKTEILLPTIHEQQKIAACLSSLDTLIAAQTDTLDALKIHKQGLMQQLFPSPDAVAA